MITSVRQTLLYPQHQSGVSMGPEPRRGRSHVSGAGCSGGVHYHRKLSGIVSDELEQEAIAICSDLFRGSKMCEQEEFEKGLR